MPPQGKVLRRNPHESRHTYALNSLLGEGAVLATAGGLLPLLFGFNAPTDVVAAQFADSQFS